MPSLKNYNTIKKKKTTTLYKLRGKKNPSTKTFWKTPNKIISNLTETLKII